MFCTECGEENRNDRKFCTNCGSKLKDYTKPVENTIMPDEIIFEQEKIKNSNRVAFKFNIALGIILLFAVGFTIASFLVPNTLRQIFSIICIACFVSYFIGYIAKIVVIKKLNKTSTKNE